MLFFLLVILIVVSGLVYQVYMYKYHPNKIKSIHSLKDLKGLDVRVYKCVKFVLIVTMILAALNMASIFM